MRREFRMRRDLNYLKMTTSYNAIVATPLTPQPGSGPHVILTPPNDDYSTGSSCGSSSSSPSSSCCCTCASLSASASVWGVTAVEGVTIPFSSAA